MPLAEPKLAFTLPKNTGAPADNTRTINTIPKKYRPKEQGSVLEFLAAPLMIAGCSKVELNPVAPQKNEEEEYPLGELKGGPLKPHSQKEISANVFAFGKKFEYGNYEEKIREVEKTLQAHPDADLVVTPEYFLYSSVEDEWSQKDRAGCPNVRISKVGGETVIEMLDEAAATKQLVKAIEKLQELAKKYSTNVVLGTFASYVGIFPVNGKEEAVYTPSLIVIDNRGNIAASHYKTTPEWNKTDWQYDEVAMASTYPVELSNKKGEKFSVLPIICAEFGSPKIYDKHRDAKIDILAVPTVNGDDAHAGKMTNRMQQGKMTEYQLPALEQFREGSSYETIRKNATISGGIAFSQGVGSPIGGTGIFYVPDLGNFKENYALDRCIRESDGVYAAIRLGR